MFLFLLPVVFFVIPVKTLFAQVANVQADYAEETGLFPAFFVSVLVCLMLIAFFIAIMRQGHNLAPRTVIIAVIIIGIVPLFVMGMISVEQLNSVITAIKDCGP